MERQQDCDTGIHFLESWFNLKSEAVQQADC